MAEITAQLVNELRQKTGLGLMDCKKSLVEADGDMDKAVELLKKKGMIAALKKSSREASEGIVKSYIHLGGKVGVLLELNCETDFVAKNEQFQELAKDICMHIAATTPLYVGRDDVPAEVVDKEKEIAAAQAEGKPPAAIEKIVQGKLDKWYGQICLLEQEFVKDSSKKIQDLLTEAISKMGENIQVGRFCRYQIGG